MIDGFELDKLCLLLIRVLRPSAFMHPLILRVRQKQSHATTHTQLKSNGSRHATKHRTPSLKAQHPPSTVPAMQQNI